MNDQRRRQHAQRIVAAIDAESRKRELTPRESLVLEHYILIADGKPAPARGPHGTNQVLARFSIRRDMAQYGPYRHTPRTAWKGTDRDRIREKLK